MIRWSINTASEGGFWDLKNFFPLDKENRQHRAAGGQ
jgi:hypothetical protein